MSDQLWLPGGPSADEFVRRVHGRIARFKESAGATEAMVELELRDGSRYVLDSLSPEPGFGFVTVCPHPGEDGEREELIVPLGSFASIRLAHADAPERFGFTLPDS